MTEQQREIQSTFQWLSTSPETTHRLGVYLGVLLHPGIVVSLHGELGAGKTVLTQGIAEGLGIAEHVTSPTFTLINRYHTAAGSELVHIDCYRLGEITETPDLEAVAIGLDEIITDSHLIVIIEWAERVASLLPNDYLQINLASIEENNHARRCLFLAHGPQSQCILQSLIHSVLAA